jgi:hypothetical protein
MVDVPDHLAPASRVSDSRIRFAGLDTLEGGGGGVFRFDFFQGDVYVGTFKFEIGPTGKGIDHMVALAHQKMNDALRQMLDENETRRQAYQKRSA